jgi:hypothetical protein
MSLGYTGLKSKIALAEFAGLAPGSQKIWKGWICGEAAHIR